MGEFFAVAFAGFAEEHGFDAAAGFEGFLYQAEAFDPYAAGVGLEAASKGDAKLFEPAVVPAGEEGIGRGLGGWGHFRGA